MTVRNETFLVTDLSRGKRLRRGQKVKSPSKGLIVIIPSYGELLPERSEKLCTPLAGPGDRCRRPLRRRRGDTPDALSGKSDPRPATRCCRRCAKPSLRPRRTGTPCSRWSRCQCRPSEPGGRRARRMCRVDSANENRNVARLSKPSIRMSHDGRGADSPLSSTFGTSDPRQGRVPFLGAAGSGDPAHRLSWRVMCRHPEVCTGFPTRSVRRHGPLSPPGGPAVEEPVHSRSYEGQFPVVGSSTVKQAPWPGPSLWARIRPW